ncbi:hypothetical protein [Pseudarthrobacter sp. 1C304]|uniref:hypothetical protein n=1 Tax=Pseudarthrobacter sp. 1C304 TaxID=3457438 RepID=UPI003FD2230A
MFSINLPEGEPWYSNKRRVVDAERKFSLRLGALTGRDPGKAFVLTHGDMRIPFHTEERTGLVDAETARPFFISEIVSFGTSIYLKGDRGVPNCEFSSADEARRLRRIAAEAVLIFGLDYNGFDYDADYVRVLLDGKILTRRDFGHPR